MVAVFRANWQPNRSRAAGRDVQSAVTRPENPPLPIAQFWIVRPCGSPVMPLGRYSAASAMKTPFQPGSKPGGGAAVFEKWNEIDWLSMTIPVSPIMAGARLIAGAP